MHQHAHLRTCNPIPHQAFSALPADKRPQDRKRRGRWAALHVCIAWHIYYNEQIKKTPKTKSLQQDETPHLSASRQPDPGARMKPAQPPCLHRNLGSWCRPDSEKRDAKADETRRYPDTRLGSSQTSEREKSRDPAAVPLASQDGKRKRGCEGSAEVTRLKRVVLDDVTVPVQQSSRTDVSFCAGEVTRTPSGLASYPEIHPYHSGSWNHVWTGYTRKDYTSSRLFGDRFLNPIMAMPPAEHRYHHLHFPLAPWERVYLRRRTIFHAGLESRLPHDYMHHQGHRAAVSNLHYSGFPATAFQAP